MDNMLSVADVLRVSPRPTSFSDFNELDWKLTYIARTYNNFKRALLSTSDQPGRSTKRQRLLTDMPREGNLSPSRRSTTPGKSSKGTSDKTSSVRAIGRLHYRARTELTEPYLVLRSGEDGRFIFSRREAGSR